MRELGESSAQLHREAGEVAAKTGKIDWVIGVAGNASEIVAGAIHAGVPRAQTKMFATSEDAAEFLHDLIAPGDVILVKGSRGVKMERIAEALIARHAADSVPPEVRH
jgi:UDP-N-acetylmuramoyl-tripeptide--D-alanyl-D-alanine ligase